MNEASCLPFTAPVPFQSQIAAVQGESLPINSSHDEDS